MDIPRITVKDLKTMIDKNNPVTVLDVRARSAYATSSNKIKGAIYLDPDDESGIAEFAKTLDRNIPTVTY